MKGTFQSITIVGNLGQDPEVRSTASGQAVGNLNVAVTDYDGKDQGGQIQTHTEWFRVVVFGKMAENAQLYLSKGSKILISGRMKTRKWQDQAGNDRYSTDLFANDMQFLGGGQGQQQGQQPQQGNQPQQQQARQPQTQGQSAATSGRNYAPQGNPDQQTPPPPQSNFDDFDDDKMNVA